MIREKLIFKVLREVPPDYSEIFGADYYDHWRFWDADSLTLTGSLIDQVDSLTGSGRNMVSSGLDRPSLSLSGIIGKNVASFDGVNEFMYVPSSSSSYNFLHNGSGGCIIYIYKINSATSHTILSTSSGATNVGFRTGVSVGIDDFTNVTNGSAITSVNLTGIAIGTSQFNSNVDVYDVNNGTTADKLFDIFNGTEYKNNVTANSVSAANATNDLYMGCRYSGTTLSPFLNGELAEAIVLKRVPTTLDKLKIQNRLTYDYSSSFPIT